MAPPRLTAIASRTSFGLAPGWLAHDHPGCDQRLPHGDPGRKAERGLSLHELDVEARHEGMERIWMTLPSLRSTSKVELAIWAPSQPLDLLHRLVVGGHQEDRIAG